MTQHFILRRVAPLAFAASALLSCGTNSSTGPNNSQFDLDFVWLGTEPAGATLASFNAAANIVRATVVGSLTPVALPTDFTNLSQCGLSGHPDIERSNISGLRIYLVVEPIDGAAGTLGSAGPCLIRNNDIPALGVMRFDEADVANLQASGRLTRVVLHEMLHVLGIGTVWDAALLDTTTTPSDARYLGPLARAACAAFSGGGSTVCAASVPVHSTDGEGSKYSHWRESVFQSELMTPFLGSGATPFSTMTIQALADIGYDVDVDQADAYGLPVTLMAESRETGPSVEMSEPMQPRWKLDGAGRLSPYRPRR